MQDTKRAYSSMFTSMSWHTLDWSMRYDSVELFSSHLGYTSI